MFTLTSQSIQYTEWAGQTTVHPIGLAVLVVMIAIVLFAKKEHVILAVLLMLLAIPSAQRVVILTLDFSFIRILIIFALMRIFFRSEHKSVTSCKPDKLILFWSLWAIIAYGFLYGNFNALLVRTGYMIEVVGAYIIGRVYVTSWQDMRKIIVFMAYASIPVAVFFTVERLTGKNIFSIMGGVPETTIIRGDRLRCQGPFSHPIMAGQFWASLVPWIAAAWYTKIINRKLLLISLISILIIVGNTASSTPVMALMIAIGGLLLFSYSKLVPAIRWGVIFTLIALHLVMEAPVWHLLARIDLAGGSTGWHRYALIDAAIRHVGEWWLVGTLYTAHWGRGLGDITNQYVLEGVRSGLLGMVLYFWFLYSVFKLTGRAIKLTTSKRDKWILWAGGVALFVHALSFLSVSYFGQLVSYLYMFIGILVSLACSTIDKKRKSMERNEMNNS